MKTGLKGTTGKTALVPEKSAKKIAPAKSAKKKKKKRNNTNNNNN